ncbi:hypothetical protein FRB93_007023 [Tulasnella sp. JGI-2019a]|nr:hypothetical protein FRB93_007023 [Tulasnella sp. JGI-2019a]
MASQSGISGNTSQAHAPISKRKVGLGFIRRRSQWLWLFFGSITLGFCIFHFQYVPAEGMRQRLLPGEWFLYQQKYYQFAMQLHLMTTLTSSILFVFQFIPYIRDNYRQFHRVSGRIAFILLFIGSMSGITISQRAFGGSMSTRSASLTLAIMTAFSTFKSWRSIRLRRVNEHRKWTLRCAFYMGSIISVRGTLLFTAIATMWLAPQYVVFRCDELDFTMALGAARRNVSVLSLEAKYPACQGTRALAVVPVLSAFRGSYEEVASVLRLSFGASMWLALVLHAVGVEFYLNSSAPQESKARQSTSKEKTT